jgi:hypothetical protein
MLKKDTTKSAIEECEESIMKKKKQLEQYKTVQNILDKLPTEILELDFVLTHLSTYTFAPHESTLFLHAPIQSNDSDNRALNLQWIKQTMGLFKTLLNTVWDEHPVCADKKTQTMTFKGDFEYMEHKFSVWISGCPISSNCKIVAKKNFYTTYDVICPEGAEVIEEE